MKKRMLVMNIMVFHFLGDKYGRSMGTFLVSCRYKTRKKTKNNTDIIIAGRHRMISEH